MKPVLLPRFNKAIGKVKELLNHSANHIASVDKDYFFIKSNSVITKVLIKDILWIEALGDYITINTNTKKFILHLTLKAMETKLPVNRFVRVHRSFIIAIDNISSVEDSTIYVGTKPIPVGALYKDSFVQHLNML